MPLKRTPPVSPSKSRSDSKTRKTKRRREGSCDDDTEFQNTLKGDIDKMFEDFKKEQNKNFKALQDTIQQQNKDIQATLEFISARYDEIQKKMESYEFERKNHLAYINTLETRLENLENKSVSTCIEIRNIPPKKSETKEDLANHIIQTGKILETSVQHCDIKNIFRTNSKSNDMKPIVVEFTTVSTKDKFLKSSKSYNRKNSSNKLNTSILKIEGPQKPVYVSELLTYKTRRLYSLARDFAKLNDFTYCWTSYGKVYLRKKEGDPYHRIDSECKLEKLIK